MDPTTVALITALCSLIAAVAAGINTVHKTEIATLRGLIADLTTRITALEGDLDEERKAHKSARIELADARTELRVCMRRNQELALALGGKRS